MAILVYDEPVLDPVTGDRVWAVSWPDTKAWDESLHPRDDDGRWIEGSGGATRDPTHAEVRDSHIAYWGGSHSGSTAITGAGARMMGVPGYKDPQPQSKVITRLATKFLTAIAASPGSIEPLFHGFENVAKITWKVGDTLTLPLLATSGSRDDSKGYGVRLDSENQRGTPTLFEFSRGTSMAGYSKAKPSEAAESGHVWNEAIVAGKFRVVALGEIKSSGYQFTTHPASPPEHPHQYQTSEYQIPITVVRLVQTETYDPATQSWTKKR